MDKGVRAPKHILYGRCPYCLERLGLRKRVALKLRRKCSCGHCGKVIDERFRIY